MPVAVYEAASSKAKVTVANLTDKSKAMATFKCYQVEAPSWLPGYNLAHGLQYEAPVHGVSWAQSEHTVAFQVDSKYDVDFLKKFLGCKLDTDNYTLRVLSVEDYMKAVQSGLAMTKAVDKEKMVDPEHAAT